LGDAPCSTLLKSSNRGTASTQIPLLCPHTARRKASAYPCGNPHGARIFGAKQTGVAATTLLKHYGKSIHALDADRAEFSKIDGEGGTDPGSAHDDEGKNSTAEVRAAARCLRLDHPACARRRKRA
jgi:hypothetical protein